MAAAKQTDQAPLFSVEDLTVAFPAEEGMRVIVDHLGLSVAPGETLCIMGESGSGKSLTAQAIMGLIESPPARITGQVLFEGENLLDLTGNARRDLNGSSIALVFQDSLAAFNPVYSIGWQIAEVFRRHQGLAKRKAMTKAVELLRHVGIPDPERRAREYPHQFSGGMRQRAAIAMAIALKPRLLIADEPTTALDVTTQAQILDLLAHLRRETGMAVIFITHDLGVVSEIADRLIVMYAGRAVEAGRADDILDNPKHPYTRALFDSWPAVVPLGSRPQSIPGGPPDFGSLGPGCAFAPRCSRSQIDCTQTRPEFEQGSTRPVACFHPMGETS